MRFFFRFSPIFALVFLITGWGSVGHKLINKKTTEAFPSTMNYFVAWSADLGNHASDADNRKNSDPNESPRHFIDIDEYAEFVQNGSINQSYEYNVSLHGLAFVIDQGILPWAILRTVDSLKLAFQQRNWNKAMLTAADLGHYVGDGHMPLHITKNYNGQLSGQTGVHSRYESTMIGSYSTSIIYTNDSATYVSDKSNYVFGFLYTNYKYVDSVLRADSIAKALAGSYNTAYYTKLWEVTKVYTTEKLFKMASRRLADLIYTAWVDAGRPDPNITSADNKFVSPVDFYLYQNFPNPFNPETSIKYQIPVSSNVTLKIYDMLGNEIAVLVNGFETAGFHEVNFKAFGLTSGLYIYRLETPYYKASKKLLLLK